MHYVQDIAVVALMLQSYLVTEEENKRLNSHKEVFEWLITILDCAISRKPWYQCNYAVIEILKIHDSFNLFRYGG